MCLRKLPEELAKLAAAPEALFVALHKGQNLVTKQPSQLASSLVAAASQPHQQQQVTWHPALLQRQAVADISSSSVRDIFLGLAPSKQAVFACDVKDEASAQQLLDATVDVSTQLPVCMCALM